MIWYIGVTRTSKTNLLLVITAETKEMYETLNNIHDLIIKHKITLYNRK